MPFSPQSDCGYLSSVGFPIRMNNGEHDAAQPSNPSQNHTFPSMLELGLVEYVRNQPPSNYLHSAVAPAMQGISQTTAKATQRVNTPQYPTNPQQHIMAPQSYMLVRNDQPPHLRVTEAPRTQYLAPTSINPVCPNSILSPASPFWSPSGIFTEMTTPHSTNDSELEETKSTTQLTEHFNQLALETQPQQPMPIPSVCSHPECPVAEPHSEGLYQYDSRRWSFRSYEANYVARAIFGASSPSPTVYASLGRLAEGRGSLRDAVAVNGFSEAHYFVAEGSG